VHRDVSPQNILVGGDGVAHLLDFGVAKAEGQLQTTREGRIKGKVSYMPPEQARAGTVTRAVDVYAAGVVLWELLAGERLFAGDNDAIVLERMLFGEVEPPSRKGGPAELDEVVMRALAKAPEDRFPTARDMARSIEAAIDVASASEVAEWLEAQAPVLLEDRRRRAIALQQGEAADGSGVRSSPSTASRDVSSVSSEARVRTPPRRPIQHALAIIGIVAAMAGGVLLMAWRTSTRAVSVPPAQSALALPPDGPPPAPSSSAMAGPAAAPEASGSPTPSPVASTRPAAARPTPRPRPPAPASSCNPPYTVGADGVKQYKLQCL
jgi:serine/threonine protein kinase